MANFYPTKAEKDTVREAKTIISGKVAGCLSGLGHHLQFAGSTELGTFVSGEFDIDAFIITSNIDSAFERVSHCLPGIQKKGELLIWHTTVNGIETDIVFMDPALPKTQTLKHTEHYNRVLSDAQKAEIVKAKALFKGRGCAGPEIGGISGIAVTELISRHGLLENLCEVVKRGTHLADPTRPERNLLASITKTRWKCIEEACGDYLATKEIPAEKYTEEKFAAERESQGFNTFRLPRQDDLAVDFSRSLSACETCANELENLEKDVKIECDAYAKHEVVVAVKAPEKLSPATERRIPITVDTSSIEAFLKAHPAGEKRDGFYVAEVQRKIDRPRQWIEECVKAKLG